MSEFKRYSITCIHSEMAWQDHIDEIKRQMMMNIMKTLEKDGMIDIRFERDYFNNIRISYSLEVKSPSNHDGDPLWVTINQKMIK